ncbi:lymphotoxin-beta isoform X2 [Oryctolagus cuniculus]|uniref:lymphotoxin-beta isoform X2 n=1 Tax=Oryctolagus cuniculus TaxID=9986 RepID=UPI0038794816
MGALELEGRGRRPQGRGCFLLAVAGATSLVTLLLAVPITVLAVLALVPQEQGGLDFSSCRRRRRRSQKQISAPGCRLPTS